MLSNGCLSVLSVTFVHCGQTVGRRRIKMKLGTQVGLGPGHIVLDGDPAPPPPKGHSRPQFSAHVCCGQMAAWIKMSIGMELRLGSGDFVLDGDPAPPPKRGAKPPPKFSAHVYCGQTAGWIKLILGMDVGLSPGVFVLDGDPAPLPQKGAEPIFDPFLLWPNGWMHQDVTWCGCWPQPRELCVRWRPSLPSPNKWGGVPSQFSAHFYCAQTAGCIKMPLGMEVGLSPGEFVLDGTQPSSPKGGRSPSPIFRVEVRISKLDRKCGALPVVANFVSLEQNFGENQE